MANIFSVLIAEAGDIQQFFVNGEQILAAFPPQPTLLSLLAFWRAEQSAIAAEEALGEKIYQAFAGLLQPTPTPGPLKALCQGLDVQAELTAEAAKLPQFDGHLLQWLITNFPTILADVEALIALFGKKTP